VCLLLFGLYYFCHKLLSKNVKIKIVELYYVLLYQLVHLLQVTLKLLPHNNIDVFINTAVFS